MAKTTRVRICLYARVSPSPQVKEGKLILSRPLATSIPATTDRRSATRRRSSSPRWPKLSARSWRYSTGQASYQEIADWLNDAGLRTRSGNRFSKDTVADMLRNPFYKGYVLYRPGSRSQDEGELFPGRQEPIVASELWDLYF